jgi:hypothetical protein
LHDAYILKLSFSKEVGRSGNMMGLKMSGREKVWRKNEFCVIYHFAGYLVFP